MSVFWIPLTILLVYLTVRFWPRSLEGQYRYHSRILFADMERRGLSPQQQFHELQFRSAMAALREELSNAVMTSPSTYREMMAEMTAQRAKLLAVIDIGLARRFVAVVDQSYLADILYPDAMRLVDAHLKEECSMPVTITAAHVAAVRTFR